MASTRASFTQGAGSNPAPATNPTKADIERVVAQLREHGVSFKSVSHFVIANGRAWAVKQSGERVLLCQA